MKGMKKGRLLLLAGAAALILGALGLLCWRYYPVVQGLLEPAQMDAFRETLQSLGAAGALEFITCVKEMEEGYIHPTVGLQETEEELDLNYVPGSPLLEEIPYALSNSLGFGGHNASLLLKKWR